MAIAAILAFNVGFAATSPPVAVDSKWMPIGWMSQPDRADSILITVSAIRWVDLAELARHLGFTCAPRDQGRRIMLESPRQTLSLAPGTPFVQCGSELLQLPLPLSPPGKKVMAPLEPLIAILARYYPGELLFDPAEPRLLVGTNHNDILGVKYQVTGSETRAAITATRVLEHQAEIMSDGTVAIHFPGATLDTAAFNFSVPQGLIADITGQQLPSEAIIAFTPEPGVVFKGLEVSKDPPICTAVFGTPQPLAPDSAAQIQLERDRRRWALDLVVIDPGHGGKDPGAIGKGGLKEKDVALDVGLRLQKALEKQGIRTVMTRDRDVFIPLNGRTQIANSASGKLFISLHCNASRDRKATGTETYFLSPAKTERAMRVAMLENEVIQYEESRDQYRDITDENFILLAMAQANFVRESQDLAAVVQEELPGGVGTKDRGVDQAGFYVLVGASMPAVLCEMGFISNPDEENRLRDKSFRQTIADEISGAVVKFLAGSQ